MTVDAVHLRRWIGRSENAADTVNLWPFAAFAATLDEEREPVPGDAIPPGGHWLLFLPHARQSTLGPDGHPRRGGFLPPVELPRRMWAGGRLEFRAPVRIGDAVTRTSTIKDVTIKEGRSGTLAFVVVRHEIFADGSLAISEEHDIVYRQAPAPNAAPPEPPPAPEGAMWARTVTPDPVLLFRYSALTFNGHRIHYDHPYATHEEGYRGLVVHGPLIATLLMDLCRRSRPDSALTRFDFRAVSPLFDDRPFRLEGVPAADGRTAKVWARGPDGQLAMTADAAFAG